MASNTMEMADRRIRRQVAALAMIPCWDLALLGSADVLVVGNGPLVDETLRGLLMLGVGHLLVAESGRDGNIEADVERWQAMAAHCAPSAVIRGLRHGLAMIANGQPLPARIDLVVLCGDDPWAQAVVRKVCRRYGVPWVDVRMDIFHGALATNLPGHEASGPDASRRDDAAKPPSAEAEAEEGPVNPAMAAIMGGLASQEAAKVLLRSKGYPTLEGRTCLVDGQTYRMIVVEPERDAA